MTYNEFIQGIINSRGQWNIPEGEYFEAHHIIPKCIGGTGEIRAGRKRIKHENLIWLYAEEHYIAHKLLAIENPTNKSLVGAWEMMAYPEGKTVRQYEVSAEDYSLLRKLWSDCMKNNNNFLDAAGHPYNYGKPTPGEQKQKLSAAKMGKKLSPHTEEAKKHHSEAVKKRYLEHPETFVGRPSGQVCITNGQISYYINKDQELPDGFYFGMTQHKTKEIKDIDAYKKQKHQQSLGKHWYNNGIENKFSFDCPEGFVKGRLYKRKKID